MIRELKTFEHVFTDEQQVKAIIKSLPKSCEDMVVNIVILNLLKSIKMNTLISYILEYLTR